MIRHLMKFSMPSELKSIYDKAAHDQAAQYAKDPTWLKGLLRQAVQKAGDNTARLQNIYEDLQALIRMVRAYLKQQYKEVPWKSIIYAVAAIIYFVNPFDLIPDAILFAGFIDDAAIITHVVGVIGEDIAKFKQWEAAQVTGDIITE